MTQRVLPWQGIGGKVRAVKDVSKEAVDATRRTIGRRKHDKKCRVHIKVGRVLQLLPETCEIAMCKPTHLYMTACRGWETI